MSLSRPRLKRFTLAAIVLLTALAAALVLVHNRAAAILSDKLTQLAGLPVKVGLIDLGVSSGITLGNITVGNPPGYAGPYLAQIDSINIKPDYAKLVRLELSIGSIRVRGPEIALAKDGRGVFNAKAAVDNYRAAQKAPSGPARKFAVGLIKVSGASIHLPDRSAPIILDELTIEGLSNEPGSRAVFSLKVNDGKAAKAQLSGSAEPFSAEPGVQAALTASVDRFAPYMSGPVPEPLRDASLVADVKLDLKGGLARADAVCGVRGIRPGKEADGKLGADLRASLSYDRKDDAVLIRSAFLDVPGITKVGISGQFKDLSKSIVGDIQAKLTDIDMNVLKAYLPKGINADGVVTVTDVYLKGPMRPFTAEAGGRLSVNNLYVSYGGKGVSGAFGGAAVKYASGRISGEYDFRLLGGGLTGGFGYGKDGGKFRLSAIKLLPSALEGLPEGAAGTVDALVEGELGPGLKTVRADYTVSANGLKYAEGVAADSIKASGHAVRGRARLNVATEISAKGIDLPKNGASISDLTVTGEASSSGKSPLAITGRAGAGGIAFGERGGGRLSFDYSYGNNQASLKAIDFTLEGLSAGINSVNASFSDRKIEASAEGGELSYGDGLARLGGLAANITATRMEDGGLGRLTFSLAADGGDAYGLPLTDIRGEASFDGESAEADFGLKLSENPLALSAKAKFGPGGLKKHDLSGNLDIGELASLAPAFDRAGLGLRPTAGSFKASFEAHGEGREVLTGAGKINLAGLSVGDAERTILSGVSAELAPVYEDGMLMLPETGIDFGGYFSVAVSGNAQMTDGGWSVSAEAKMPRKELSAIQEGVLEALPPKLMWADVSGGAALSLRASYSGPGGARLDGEVELDRATVDLPDMGLSIGPAEGRIPIGLYLGGEPGGPEESPFRGEVFDRENYPELMYSYASVPDDADIVIDKIRYGFVELDSVTLALNPGKGYYDIDWFGLYAFDGRLVGYGRADLAGGRHALSLIMSDFSLRELCDTVPAIKGYLSGRVDGLMRLVLAGREYKGVTGAARFWAEDGEDEDREISKEFIKKLMGSSMKKYMTLFIGDRYFDTGELDIVFSKGNLVFENLLIANTNFFGQRDLNITVAPVSNRITIEHLLEVIRDVKARAGTK